MLERIILGILYLSGWHISTCLLRQYHHVPDVKNWTEAQTYCRQTYTDLATIENMEEMTQLNNTVSSTGHSSDVWIGLYSEIDWKWSDGFTGRGAEYRNWKNSYNQKLSGFHEICVFIGADGEWWDLPCLLEHPFICYNRTQRGPEFVLVKEEMNHSSAQRYCRERFTDLATVRNDLENQKARDLVPRGKFTWIGLFGHPNSLWSDQSRFFFSNYNNSLNPVSSDKVMCGVASSQRSGKWKLLSCERRLPFVCYSIPPASLNKQVVKMGLKSDDSVNLNNPNVKAELLKKLQDRLKEKGVSGVTLKWREQCDGKVLEKEGKNKKTEL